MPAWIAGNQIRKDASGNIRVNLDSALHAGMAQSRGSLRLTEVLLPHIFRRRITKDGDRMQERVVIVLGSAKEISRYAAKRGRSRLQMADSNAAGHEQRETADREWLTPSRLATNQAWYAASKIKEHNGRNKL